MEDYIPSWLEVTTSTLQLIPSDSDIPQPHFIMDSRFASLKLIRACKSRGILVTQAFKSNQPVGLWTTAMRVLNPGIPYIIINKLFSLLY